MPSPALYINEWISGLYTQRSPLVTPTSSQGLSTIVRTDSLAGGQNMEISNRSTLVRRPGWTRYNSATLNRPLNYHAFRNLSGTYKLLVDSTNFISVFDGTSITGVTSKPTAQQSYFQSVGNLVYFVNGTLAACWDGTSLQPWGLTPPANAPVLGATSTTGSVMTLTKGRSYCFVYKTLNGKHVSSGSPLSLSTGALTGKNQIVTGSYSADSNVALIDIYGTLDGGSNYYYLATIPNVVGTGTWSYTDSSDDSALQTFQQAPINHANDRVPTGASLICYHAGRLWVAAGNKLYFAGGPDTLVGSPEDAFPPSNVFIVPGTITAIAPTSQGLLVFMNGDSYIVRGADSSSFYIQPWQSNFGVSSQNCIAQDGDLLYVYTSQRQLFAISSTLEEVGFAIGDKLLASFDPAQSYIALHRNGTDSGLFISDGSTTIYRYLISKDCWATSTTVMGGISCIKSIAISDSNYRLMGGRATNGGYILFRDVTNFTDDGTAYPLSVAVGQLVIAPLGEIIALDAVSVERMPIGSPATVSVLLQELSGTFTALPNPVQDPPTLPAATTLITQRHYLKAAQTPLPQRARHLQVLVEFPSENFQNELLGFALLKP